MIAPAGYVTEEYGAQSLAAVSRVYKRFGLLPESTDFAAALAEYARLERIFYCGSNIGCLSHPVSSIVNLPSQAVAQIAAAWSGDQLSAYPEGESYLTAWISAWKNADDARRLYRAYQTVLERRHRLRFAEPAGLKDTLLAEPAGNGSMLLQHKGPFVLLLDGPSAARARQLAGDIWQSLDAETGPPSFLLIRPRATFNGL